MSKKNAKEDLFNSAMSLGDHLEELRARLIMAFIGLGIAMVVCLIFGKYLIAFLERPYVSIARSQQQNITSSDPNSTIDNSLRNAGG
ncbi:MAG: twin-arginine translocase subunit TatC [Planctomycetota bacterium]|jgi:Sec-independent protein secretion pathway component TatC